MGMYLMLVDEKMESLPDSEWPDVKCSEDHLFLDLFDSVAVEQHRGADCDNYCFRPKSISELSQAINDSAIINKNRYIYIIKLMREKYNRVWIYISY